MEQVFGRLKDVMIWLTRNLCIIQHLWQSLATKLIRGRLVIQLRRKKYVLFEMMCEWLEKDSDCELYTLQELLAKMEELTSGNESTYSERSLQSKLKEKYRDHIYFANLPGRPNIVCFRDMVLYILYEQKNPKKKQEKQTSLSLLQQPN